MSPRSDKIDRLERAWSTVDTDMPWLIAAAREAEALRSALHRVRSIGATSGTNIHAWNEAFNVIDAALSPSNPPDELPLVFCMRREPHPPHDWTNDVSPTVHCWGYLARGAV